MNRNYVKVIAGAAVAALLVPLAVHAAGLWPNFPIVGGASYCSSFNQPGGPGTPQQCTNTVPAGPPMTGLEQVPADTRTTGGGPQTVLVPLSQAAGSTWGTPRNFLGNGALNITNTNGTSTVTCATTSAMTVAALSADRWGCDANVGSGVGRTAIVTSSPTPPTGFTNAMKVWRNSGALTQPVCVMQAVPATQSAMLAGQQVTLSAYVAALAGLAADNGGTANLVIITGTGTDEGLTQSWTASPAITPAWTGIATLVNTTINLSTTFARYSTTATIPSTATEIGVMLCFTPTATGSGATDGFAWTGAQLEKAPGASLFEVRAKADENRDALQYFYRIVEGAVGAVHAPCTSSTTSLETCILQFPVPMYKTPTMSYTSGFGSCSTTACSAQTACTVTRTSTLQSGFAATNVRVPIDCTSSAGFPAAGSATLLMDDAGSGIINAWTGL